MINIFPDLTAEDIEVRAARITDKRVELLLYKDARCDMRILDEAVGPMNWMRSHEIIDDVCYCTVSIFDESKNQWIAKQDCGTPGDFEAVKAASSDAFKRACFNWGIGRELYTAPRIAFWVEQDGEVLCNVSKNRQDRWVTYDDFSVRKVEIEDHRIKRLWVVNDTLRKTVFVWNPIDDDSR